jgi:hypothetical protein
MNENKNIEKITKEIIELERKMNDPDLCKGTAHTYARVSG